MTSPLANTHIQSPLMLLPNKVIANIYRFEPDAFQRVATCMRKKLVAAFQFYQRGIIRESVRSETSFYTAIRSIQTNNPFHYHIMVRTAANMYGRKWGCKLSLLPSADEVLVLNQQIQQKKEQHLLYVWKVLQPMVELTQNAGLELPALDASAEMIEAWIERNPHRCFGVTIRSLPLSRAQVDALGGLLNKFKNGAINPADIGPMTFISGPTLVYDESNLRARLAEDADSLLQVYNINSPWNTMGIIQTALARLVPTLQGQSLPTHTSICVDSQIEGNRIISCEINERFDSDISTATDPRITLNFQVSQDLKWAWYFDEHSLRGQIALTLYPKVRAAGFTMEEWKAQRSTVVSEVLTYLRCLHLSQSSNGAIPVYREINFEVKRVKENKIDAVGTPGPCLQGIRLPLMHTVTLRWYVTNKRKRESDDL